MRDAIAGGAPPTPTPQLGRGAGHRQIPCLAWRRTWTGSALYGAASSRSIRLGTRSGTHRPLQGRGARHISAHRAYGRRSSPAAIQLPNAFRKSPGPCSGWNGTRETIGSAFPGCQKYARAVACPDIGRQCQFMKAALKALRFSMARDVPRSTVVNGSESR